jgi:hypothetical protein
MSQAKQAQKKEPIKTLTGKINGSAVYRNISGIRKGDKFNEHEYDIVKKTISELGYKLLGQR